jgi:hypothetical protein
MIASAIKPITIWIQWNQVSKSWDYNHFGDGHLGHRCSCAGQRMAETKVEKSTMDEMLRLLE